MYFPSFFLQKLKDRKIPYVFSSIVSYEQWRSLAMNREANMM
jgi:hypothetical protein